MARAGDRLASRGAVDSGNGRTCAGEERSRGLHVERDLPAQRLDVVELLLVAELAQKLHPDLPAVDVAVEIENVHFQRRGPLRVDRRAHAQARCTGQGAGLEAVDANGEDALER